MESIRRHGRRVAWQMAGAAIGLAVVLVVVVVVTVAAGRGLSFPGPLWPLVAVMSLLLAALLGVVPGVRELEVTGARSMLGADGDLLAPHRPRAAHHLQTAVWVVLHLLTGLLVATLFATLLPASVVHLVELALDRPLGSGVPLPDRPAVRLGAAALALLVVAASALAWWPLGTALARLAPRFLGPTTADRLELVQQRADREAEHTRIARELHDGIGHSLTVVGIQAAAARAVQDRDPAAVAAALSAIEDTARAATEELDTMLALLREEPATSPTGAGDDALDRLLAARRRDGMELRTRIDLPTDLAALQRLHLVRSLAELLTNAQRHGAPGPVAVTLTAPADRVVLEVTNPLRADEDDTGPSGAPDAVGGRGLRGLRERAALLGGTVTAGPRDGRWAARLDLPRLTEETR